VRSKIDNLLEAIGQGIVDHALAREKLEAYKKQKADLEAQISQESIPSPMDISIPWNIFGTIMELIRSALEKKKPLELRNFLKGFIQKIVVTSTGVKVQYNPLHMVMSNKPGSSLFPMLAPRAGLEPAT
jgi:hypothetical protein